MSEQSVYCRLNIVVKDLILRLAFHIGMADDTVMWTGNWQKDIRQKVLINSNVSNSGQGVQSGPTDTAGRTSFI